MAGATAGKEFTRVEACVMKNQVVHICMGSGGLALTVTLLLTSLSAPCSEQGPALRESEGELHFPEGPYLCNENQQ